MKHLEAYLDSLGPKGSSTRLTAISELDLGERSLAAQRVLQNRCRRTELFEMGFTPRQVAIIMETEKEARNGKV